MTDVMRGLVSEAKKNKFSSIGPDLTDDDVYSVWDNVSAYIEKQMALQKAVNIPGLGTFSFAQKKLDVGNNKYILTQRPVFMLSEKLAQTHGLNYTKYCISGQIPVVQLNFSVLSAESPFDRDTVEACVKEVLQAMSRSVAMKKNVDFAFNGIGRLQIRDNKVKMRFYKDFINSMDGSGKLLESMQDRPGTIDSVISNRSQSRPISQNTLILPRIGEAGVLSPDAEAMPPIDEEGEGLNDKLEDQGDLDFTDPYRDPNDPEQAMKDLMAEFDPEEPSTDTKKLSQPDSRIGSRLSIPMAKVMGMSLADDVLADKPSRVPSVLSKSAPNPFSRRSLSPIGQANGGHNPRLSPINNEAQNGQRSQTAEKLDKPLPPPMPHPPSEQPPGTACGHNAGQELCYLCHQRERRNVPVYFTEERKKRQEEEDRMLQQFQHLRDMEAIINEQEKSLAKRYEDQKIAAFNLGISEAVKSKKTSRPSDFHTSYVFQKRPLTPPRFIKQEQYYRELSNQVHAKDEKTKKRKSDEDFLERLEQVQLAEDLAAQREQYLKDKRQQQDQYKRALSAQCKIGNITCTSPNDFAPRIRAGKQDRPLTLPRPKILLPFSCIIPIQMNDDSLNRIIQVRFKPLPLPIAVPDSSEPVFGKDDMTNEGMAERRRRANELYKEQLAIVERRKRDAILKRLQEQKEEESMLQRTKKDLLDDRAERFERAFGMRKKLEEDWIRALQTKRAKDQEEKDHLCDPGQLLTEQFDRYKRCQQCDRRLNNCGESNIWRESHYVPGSRIMV